MPKPRQRHKRSGRGRSAERYRRATPRGEQMSQQCAFTPEFSARAKKLGLSERFLQLLESRGLSDAEIPAFLRPSLDALSPAEDIVGMTAARDRLRLAIERKERVLVFGDYDCDGICAVSILVLALRDRTDVTYFIPNRITDGYGLSVEALKRIVARRKPDLVVTVDCGVTAVAEVEYLRSVGVDVIVTDHHEPQGQLPDCIVVDAKTERRGFSDYCGAGVALQLVRSMFGAEYERYLDICALATIADVVPLVGDNRIIASLGLAKHNAAPRKGLKMLAGGERLSSQDVMFRVAPRINAAGRLGSALKVVDLFLEEDYFLLKTLTEELERDNARRQEVCEQVVAEAKEKLRGFDFSDTRIIILHGADWESGVLGIAAARLVEEFKCPAVLFAGDGDEYKGSARSVRSVNIFELLSRHSSRFTSFGGHSQAAGLSVRAENFDAFRAEITADVRENYPAESFMPAPQCDMRLSPDEDFLALARELSLLEPTGYGNPRPVFGLTEKGMKFRRVGFTPHVKYENGDLELMAFSRYESLLRAGDSTLETEFGMETNVFRNRIYAQGILKEVTYRSVGVSDAEALSMCLHQLRHDGKCVPETVSAEQAEEFLKQPFGTVFVVFNGLEYRKLTRTVRGADSLPVFVGAQKWLNPANCVAFAPLAGFDFRYFKRVIVAGKALSEGYLACIAGQSGRCLALGDVVPAARRVPDEVFRRIYSAYAVAARTGMRFSSPEALAAEIAKKAVADDYQTAVGRLVLEELGLISVSDRGIITVNGGKTELSRSAVYRNVAERK